MSIEGFNLDFQNVRVEVELYSGERIDISSFLSGGRYSRILNLGGDGFNLTDDHNKLHIIPSTGEAVIVDIIKPVVELPPEVSWVAHTEIRSGREPSGGFEVECKLPSSNIVIVGIGGRVRGDNLTTLVLKTAPITENNIVDLSRTSEIRCGTRPDAGVETILTVGDQEVLAGVGMRVRGDNLTTIKGLARKLDPSTGKLRGFRLIYAGTAPNAGPEAEWFDISPGTQLLITGVSARVKGDNVVTLMLNIGKITQVPREH